MTPKLLIHHLRFHGQRLRAFRGHREADLIRKGFAMMIRELRQPDALHDFMPDAKKVIQLTKMVNHARTLYPTLKQLKKIGLI